MSPREAQRIVESLANGVDPVTGEVLDREGTLSSAQVVRALFLASKVLGETTRKGELAAGRAGNAGKPWSGEEDARLLQSFDAGAVVRDLASLHLRSEGGIRSRLVRLGRINDRAEAR